MNDTLFRSEDERAFKQQFVTQFLASWTAIYYVEHSLILVMDNPKPLVQDAMLYAQNTWDELNTVL